MMFPYINQPYIFVQPFMTWVNEFIQSLSRQFKSLSKSIHYITIGPILPGF